MYTNKTKIKMRLIHKKIKIKKQKNTWDIICAVMQYENSACESLRILKKVYAKSYICEGCIFNEREYINDKFKEIYKKIK